MHSCDMPHPAMISSSSTEGCTAFPDEGLSHRLPSRKRDRSPSSGSAAARDTALPALATITTAILQAGTAQVLNASCAPASPVASSPASGTRAHPLDVRTPSEDADSGPSDGSSGAVVATTSWDVPIVCAPTEHPDDDSNQIILDITVIDADDALVLPSSGVFRLPTVSTEFPLPQPRRGPVGSIALHKGYLDIGMPSLQISNPAITTSGSAAGTGRTLPSTGKGARFSLHISRLG